MVIYIIILSITNIIQFTLLFITYKDKKIIKVPIIKTGTMMYDKEDPDKIPYRWKYWDNSERESTYYEFCNKKEAKYRYKIVKNW
jgi:hypothetical protein